MKKNNGLRKLMNAINTVGTMVLMAVTVSATETQSALQQSTLYTGTARLISDATAALTLLCPAVGGLFALYFWIRWLMVEENEKPMWAKNIKRAIIGGVGGMLISGVISLISSYFVVTQG